MTSEKWYEKVWKAIVLVFSTLWKWLVTAVKWFISVFNSWHKLAAIVLAIFAWNWLQLSFIDKVGAFALFAVLALLIFDIAADAK